jgi:hypothetical protein
MEGEEVLIEGVDDKPAGSQPRPPFKHGARLAGSDRIVLMTELNPIKAALAACTGQELRAVADATSKVPQVATGLLAWLEVACEWELRSPGGRRLRAAPPAAAILPEEDIVSNEAVAALRALFGSDAPAIVALFDALQLLIGGTDRKH